MKPKKLIMSAFCPYAEKVEIDFERFDENGLFLIAGDTGAGKTTIFDGISFALFGEVSGENRGANSLRSHFAKQETKTFVHFIFENKGTTYEVTRNPSYMRPSKRGDSSKLVAQAAQAELLLGKKASVSGNREVTSKVVDILGVNHQQFKQIAMIAQGEFLKLLFADSEERGEIFRRVFATEFYEKIQDQLKSDMNNCAKALKDVEREILSAYGRISCNPLEAGYEDFLDLKKSVYGAQKVIGFLDELLEKKTGQKQKDLEQIANYQEALNGLIEEISSGQALNKLILEFEAEKNKYMTLVAGEDDIKKAQGICQLGKKALYSVKAKMDEWQRLVKEEKNLKEEIDKNQERLKDNRVRQKNSGERLEALKSQDKKRQEIAFAIQTITDSLADYEKLEVKSKAQEKNEGEQKKADRDRVILEEEIKNNQARLSDLKARLEALKDSETRVIVYGQEKKDIDKKSSQLLKLNEAIKALQANEKDLIKARNDFQKGEENFQVKKKNYDQRELLFYREQAGILAGNLQDNQPCPVCGALDHPNKAQKSPQAPSQDQLKQEKDKLEEARVVFQKLSEQSSQLKNSRQNKLDQLEKDVLDYGLARWEDLKELEERIKNEQKKKSLSRQEVLEKLEKAKKETAEKKECQKEVDDLEGKEALNKNQLEAVKQALGDYGLSLSGLKAEIQGLRARLNYDNKKMAEAEVAKKERDLERMVKALEEAQKDDESLRNKIAQGQSLIQAGEKRLQAISASLKEAKLVLEKTLVANGFASADEYRQALLTEAQIMALEKTIKDYQDDKIRSQAAISQFEKQINQREKVAIDDLKAKKEGLHQDQVRIQKKVEASDYNIKTNQGIKTALVSYERQRVKCDQELIAIKNLSDTANGNLSGKDKLAFEQYVQGVYLDLVLVEANKRFKKMTGNRYYLLRRQDASDKRSKAGLEIDVRDEWTRQSRGVKSLSGGESFKASMALALGLADIIQRFSGGVELNTVFIDEGFGSLDGESLEKAMEILADLAEGNRLVGIISHLDELKGKIDQKIVIKRDPQGSTISLEAGIN